MSDTESTDTTEKGDWSAAQVVKACDEMQRVENTRATDRALIDNLFNGGRPYTPAEVEKYQIHINVNWMEGTRLLISAINQLNNSLIFKERYFVAIPKKCPPEKKDEYSEIFTRNAHEILKNGIQGQRQMFLLKSRNASVALHGIGPIMWLSGFRWRGRYIPLEDLLIPTDTLCDFSNLMFFGVNLYLTVGEFFDMTHTEKVDERWNVPAVRRILDDLIKPNQQQPSSITFQEQPEKRAEWIKQNRWVLDTDTAATVKLRLFFYKDCDSKKWHRCVLLREGTPHQPAAKEFLYDGRDVDFADNISHFIHVQYGDNSLVPPLKYHSVRGLGVMLYSAIECNNRLRCEFVQHVLFNLKTLLRISNPADRDRPKVLDLSQYSVIEDGVSMIPAQERHQIDSNLVSEAQSQMRQLMSESSSSYVQNINDGTSKEMTATEAGARMQSVNAQVSAMLQCMYAQEEYYWQEEVRRFCDPNSEDEEIEEFQKACVSDGIPKQFMYAGNWKTKVERVLGGGDQFLAVQEANALLGQSQRFDPTSQRTILKKWVMTLSRDPKMAELLVPSQPNQNSEGAMTAENIFATLYEGIPLRPREGIERTDYIESLIGMMGAKIQQINQSGEVGTPEDLVGLNNVGNHIGQNIAILQQDPNQKQAVKIYSDELGNLMNMVKAFGQRQQEAAQKAAETSQINPEAEAKARATMMNAEVKKQASEANTNQKLQHKQALFEQDMMQKMKAHELEMQQMLSQMQTDVLAKGTKTGAEIASIHTKAAAQANATAEK